MRDIMMDDDKCINEFLQIFLDEITALCIV